jgi:subtilisin family serine protease
MSKLSKLTGIFFVGLAAVACSDSPTNPPAAGNANQLHSSRPSRTGAPLDVPAVHMDRPPRPRAWDTSAVALVAAIAAESGHAVVVFKELTSARALETGLHAAVSAAAVNAGLNFVRAKGGEILDLYDAMGAAHVRMNPSLATVLRANPLVDFIEPRQWLRKEGMSGMTLLASDPLGTPQTVPWGIQMVRAPEAWSVTRGTGAKIYLIDTGHQRGHEDLPLIPTENCGGGYGGCDDAYVSHGSHVLGIWTARDNAVGVEGVAPGVNAEDVYVWGACADSNEVGCPTDQIIMGLNAAIFNADVVNMSLGDEDYNGDLAFAVAVAWNHDIVLVAAAGNVPPHDAGDVVYPANYSHVIGVSGVQADKSFASWSNCGIQSNYGPHVDLAAPFEALSTVPGGYVILCGTSMATPHVSGAAALLRAQNPTWTNQQVVDRLLSTAQDLGSPGRDNFFGYGLVDAARALGLDVALTAHINGLTTITTAGTHTWSAIASGGTGSYSYQWWYMDLSAPPAWIPLGTEQTQDLYVDQNSPPFYIDVAVTSGSQMQEPYIYVHWSSLSVSIRAPNTMRPDVECWVTATAQAGTPPYTYEWSTGATGSSTLFEGGSISVTATDADGTQAYASAYSQIDENANSNCEY